jgi:hypothetical protein
MKKVKDTKKLLFENMIKLNPDFKPKEVLTEEKKEVITEDKKWIQKAVDPEHKGYCTPMTKPTCTPRRKALAKRFKKGIEDEGVVGGEPQEMSTEEKYEELVGLIDNMYDVIHSEEEVEPEVSEPETGETPESGEILGGEESLEVPQI